MPILKFLDLSTAHITSKDAKLLKKYTAAEGHPPGSALIAYPYEYGWTVSTSGMLNDKADREECLAGMREEGFSEHFVNMMVYAADNETQMVRLDRDGDCEPGLPTFDWEKGDEMTPAEEPAAPCV